MNEKMNWEAPELQIIDVSIDTEKGVVAPVESSTTGAGPS